MKKILAILVGATMMFSACVTSEPTGPAGPNFPEVQCLTVESGKSYDIKFKSDEAWSISLPAESLIYATLTYDGVTDSQFFGEAGEHTISVNIREGLVSYARDYVINVEITMREVSRYLAVLVVPKIPYEINVSGSAPVGMEDDVQSTFEEGGHPENGPFASAANTYTVKYLNRADAKYGDYVVTHDCDLPYNYVVYAKSSKDSDFEAVENNSNAWLSLRKFGSKREKFSLEMIHDNAKAVFTEGVGYEAYVNLEDENGDAIVSVYFIYDPSAVAPVKPAIELAYPEEAAANGVTFVGSDRSYALNIPSLELLGNNKATSLKILGFSGGGYTTENLDLEASEVSNVYYTVLAEGVAPEQLVRENILLIGAANADGAKDYTITVVFDWIKAE